MCGIVGYIGSNNAVPILIDGLKKLEYRGYDSAGIAINQNNELYINKKAGRIKNLEKAISEDLYSTIGIGHTRWATHGEPTEVNAHPHYNKTKSIAVIHNGIIENYMEIKKWLMEDKGVVFESDTDTEVIAHLIDQFYKGDLVKAVEKSVKRLLLDIDHVWDAQEEESGPLDFDKNVILTKLSNMHKISRQAFWNVTTEEAKEAWK